ncbi:hypothetical protein [Thiomicrospira microaerophila]|uniref:hypothetical protein n=1 Tax=Thiomicrospira microaerophila TaxID=406020 RepID=UPI0005CB6FC1|nr:hypothetical protein [Thiomicrospira microaerophila]
MKLSQIYGVKSRYSRSTRIDTDFCAKSFDGLLFHATAEKTLNTIANEFKNNHRAFTLTGPYGSGKSTVSLLLSGILSNDPVINEKVTQILGTDNVEFYKSRFNCNEQGFLIIQAVGGLNLTRDMLIESIKKSLKSGNFTSTLQWLSNQSISSDYEFIEVYKELHSKLLGKVNGVLLIHDELGKSLEHISRENGDLHIFQEIGEHVSRLALPSIYIGLLHQGFSEYAKGQGFRTREEWAKIQGRFIDVLYQVSTDEIMTLISASIELKEEKPAKSYVRIKEYHSDFINSYAREDLKSSKSFSKNVLSLGPLHPYVVSALGIISRRQFSQNERSIFSFLGSLEPNSFRSFLENTDDGSDKLYELNDLWDFLEHNLEFHIIPSEDGANWNAVKDALNRVHLKCKSNHASKILKSIAILNLFGGATHLFASENVIRLANISLEANEVKHALRELEQHSIIQYKSHIHSYVVFAGSDVDVVQLVKNYSKSIGTDDWLSEVRTAVLRHLIIAKRFYHETGSLKWLDIKIVQDFEAVRKLCEHWLPDRGSSSTLVLTLEKDVYDSCLEHKSSFENRYVFGLVTDFESLSEPATELFALRLIEAKEGGVLAHDKIARQLVKERKAIAHRQLEAKLKSLLKNIVWEGEESLILTELASNIMEKVFPKSISLNNEMINREKLSGTAVTARRKLMEMMVDSACYTEENLGFDNKFPPEKAIYLSCIKNLGLHGLQGQSEWGYQNPTYLPIKELFDTTLAFLSSRSFIVSLDQIQKMWFAPPYGLSSGLFPLFITAFIQLNQKILAIYDYDVSQKFKFVPEADEIIVTKILKKPEHVGIRFTNQMNLQPHLIKRLSEINTGIRKYKEESVLAVARELVTFTAALPKWTQSTRSLSKKTIQFRNTALKSDDPFKLVFEDIPEIFGHQQDMNPELIRNDLDASISELREAFPSLLNSFKQQIKESMGEFDSSFKERCRKVADTASDYRLKGFAERCYSATDEDIKWIESIISLLASTSSLNWTDGKIDIARESLNTFVRRFYQILKLDTKIKTHDIMTVSILSEVSGEQQENMIHIKIKEIADSDGLQKQVNQTLSSLDPDSRIYLLKQLLTSEIEKLK